MYITIIALRYVTFCCVAVMGEDRKGYEWYLLIEMGRWDGMGCEGGRWEIGGLL